MVNMQQLMQQAQGLQKKMQEAQENLKNIEVEGVAGGGMIKVIMTASGKIKKIAIDDSLMNKEEKDILEDLLVAAMNDAKNNADSTTSDQMGNATGGMSLPKMPF